MLSHGLLLLRVKKLATRKHRFFFFQAEDGIRDTSVTGVQTCALPISRPLRPGGTRALRGGSRRSLVALPLEVPHGARGAWQSPGALVGLVEVARACSRERSEERRVGKG